MTCKKGGHALYRLWADGLWWLACCNCPYRIEDHPRALKKRSR